MDAYSESELTESDDRQIEKTWKLRKFQKKGLTLYSFRIQH